MVDDDTEVKDKNEGEDEDEDEIVSVQRGHYPCCKGAPPSEGFVHPSAPGIIDCFPSYKHHHQHHRLCMAPSNFFEISSYRMFFWNG